MLLVHVVSIVSETRSRIPELKKKERKENVVEHRNA